MALEFNFGNPNEALSLSLQGLRDYYATIDDPERKAEEIRKGRLGALGTASSILGTSARQGAKTGATTGMASPAGYRDSGVATTAAKDTEQLIKMQQANDAIQARLKGIAMGQQLAGQQGQMGLEDDLYYQKLKENAAKRMLEDQEYIQNLEDISQRQAHQENLLRIDKSYQPSGWDRFFSQLVGQGAQMGGYALGNYWNQPSYDTSILSEYLNTPTSSSLNYDFGQYSVPATDYSLGTWNF